MKSVRRVIEYEGMMNFRDMGGFATLDGRVTQFNVFFRSEEPINFSPQQLLDLQCYGISCCIDLHGILENNGYHHPLENSPNIHYKCISALSDIINHTGSKRDGFKAKDWLKVNSRMLEINREWIKEIIHTCAIEEGGILIHCRTGKSRTSLIIAILMMIARVPAIDIISDFAVTELYMNEKYKKMYRTSFHSKGFYKSSSFIMENLIEYINTTYDSVENYLFTCGITNDEIEIIRNKFTIEL